MSMYRNAKGKHVDLITSSGLVPNAITLINDHYVNRARRKGEPQRQNTVDARNRAMQLLAEWQSENLANDPAAIFGEKEALAFGIFLRERGARGSLVTNLGYVAACLTVLHVDLRLGGPCPAAARPVTGDRDRPEVVVRLSDQEVIDWYDEFRVPGSIWNERHPTKPRGQVWGSRPDEFECSLIFRLMTKTGLRAHEVCGEVGLQSGLDGRLNGALYGTLKTGVFVNTHPFTKTRERRAPIALVGDLASDMVMMRDRAIAAQRPTLFSWAKSRQLKVGLAQAAERAEVDATAHDLRKYATSTALEAGIPIEAVSVAVGAGVETLRKHYARINADATHRRMQESGLFS